MTLGWDASIEGRQIHVGSGTTIESGARIATIDERRFNESIHIGSHCEIRPGAQILSWLGTIRIGNHCSVNANTILYGTGGITIGDNVRIAGGTMIVSSTHNHEDTDRTIQEQGISSAPIHIESDCWIGGGVTILHGVTIGTGSIIAAGAVVREDVQPYSVVGGVPSKLLKRRK